ncbi:hypothetical protein Leryth_000892 [Lithospermum erythrorhizon]|nr:hypothetical protein Leryth_000892 [Lithospermum erythrorhizon]
MKFLIPLFKCFVATSENIITSSDGRNGDGFRVFTFNELKVATNGYRPSNKIGEGDSGSVYQVLHLSSLNGFKLVITVKDTP